MVPPETERVWDFQKAQPALSGFVLIGGTALALRIAHRRSEDLDLAFPEARLPRVRLEALRRQAAESGFEFRPDDDEATVGEFACGGMEVQDYQQEFLIRETVRASFFVPDVALAKVLTSPPEGKVRLASQASVKSP